MRNIKKTIKTTIVDVYAANTDTMQLEKIATFEYVGGLGERLAISRAKKEYGANVFCKVSEKFATYKMDAAVFLKYAELCTEDEKSEDESEDETEF